MNNPSIMKFSNASKSEVKKRKIPYHQKVAHLIKVLYRQMMKLLKLYIFKQWHTKLKQTNDNSDQ